jgi:hypothetical protein
MQVLSGSGSVTILVERENQFFNFTQQTTVYEGSRFVNVTMAFSSTVPDVYISFVAVKIESKSYCYRVPEEHPFEGGPVFWDPGTRVVVQII